MENINQLPEENVNLNSTVAKEIVNSNSPECSPDILIQDVAAINSGRKWTIGTIITTTIVIFIGILLAFVLFSSMETMS